MTETTNQTEQQPKQTMKVYYWSSKDVPFAVIYSPVELPNQFPLTKDAPDPSFKNPVYDWQKMVWFDSSEEVQGKQLADMQAKVAQLQKTAQANSEEKDKLTTALDNMQKGQEQLTQMLAGFMAGGLPMPKMPTAPTQGTTTPQAPVNQTAPVAPTTTQNGGTK